MKYKEHNVSIVNKNNYFLKISFPVSKIPSKVGSCSINDSCKGDDYGVSISMSESSSPSKSIDLFKTKEGNLADNLSTGNYSKLFFFYYFWEERIPFVASFSSGTL